ncbi:hypothetical protein FLA_2869 [Filimonas lacunae]|nr:hypothetical protein FLA_2869 [Filimonas lacunae]
MDVVFCFKPEMGKDNSQKGDCMVKQVSMLLMLSNYYS